MFEWTTSESCQNNQQTRHHQSKITWHHMECGIAESDRPENQVRKSQLQLSHRCWQRVTQHVGRTQSLDCGILGARYSCGPHDRKMGYDLKAETENTAVVKLAERFDAGNGCGR